MGGAARGRAKDTPERGQRPRGWQRKGRAEARNARAQRRSLRSGERRSQGHTRGQRPRGWQRKGRSEARNASAEPRREVEQRSSTQSKSLWSGAEAGGLRRQRCLGAQILDLRLSSRGRPTRDRPQLFARAEARHRLQRRPARVPPTREHKEVCGASVAWAHRLSSVEFEGATGRVVDLKTPTIWLLVCKQHQGKASLRRDISGHGGIHSAILR